MIFIGTDEGIYRWCAGRGGPGGGRGGAVAGAEAVRLAGWTPLNAPPAPRTTVAPGVRALAAAPGVWFAAVSGAGLWSSGDGGRTWAQCPGLPSEVHAI